MPRADADRTRATTAESRRAKSQRDKTQEIIEQHAKRIAGSGSGRQGLPASEDEGIRQGRNPRSDATLSEWRPMLRKRLQRAQGVCVCKGVRDMNPASRSPNCLLVLCKEAPNKRGPNGLQGDCTAQCCTTCTNVLKHTPAKGAKLCAHKQHTGTTHSRAKGLVL